MSELDGFLPGPTKGGCQCRLDDCTLYGTLKRPWADGSRCVKGCACPRCRGKRNRAKGDRKALQARKALGVTGANTRHEEHWAGQVRLECKAGAQVKPMWTAFLKAENQSEQARPFGDNRPFVMTAAVDGQSDHLVSFRLSVLREVIAALYEQLEDGAA